MSYQYPYLSLSLSLSLPPSLPLSFSLPLPLSLCLSPTLFLSRGPQGVVATAATQPVDVLKTRMMNSQPGEFRSITHCFLYTARTGPMGFFKASETLS